MSKNILVLLLFISCSIHAIGQTDYYYSSGKKFPLSLNENKVVVCIPKKCGEIIERFHANVQTLCMIKDETFDIHAILRSEYEKFTSLDSWSEDSKSVILTSCYYADTEGNKEVFATPYLNVRLKKEEDIDLLNSYVKQYKLTVVKKMPSMPLWYILHINPESEKSPLECANELYESGNFAESVPDLAGSIDLDTAIRSVASAIPEVSSDLYDLQGRRLTDKPTKGIYIQNGRKYVVVK